MEQNNSGWQGKLDLVYAPNRGKTVTTSVYAQAPLKIQRPFYPEDKLCHSVIVHTAGGVVGGDRLLQNITLKPQAQSLITTAAAQKIYRSNGKVAIAKTQINLDIDSYLEWLPQATIVFEGARFQQHLEVNLSPGAVFLGWEINRFGRTAGGEQFLQGEWRSHTSIYQNHKPLWLDRQSLWGSPKVWSSPHGLANQPVVGSLIYFGRPVDSFTLGHIRNLWHGNNDRPAQVGATQTQAEGLLCRYRGASTVEVHRWFTAVWGYLRQTYMHLRPIKPRVWL